MSPTLQDGLECQQLPEDAADGPHVDGGVVQLATQQQLGRTVPQRYHLHAASSSTHPPSRERVSEDGREGRWGGVQADAAPQHRD